jgi:hypothetical protein
MTSKVKGSPTMLTSRVSTMKSIVRDSSAW